jgi:hypothetical protein
MPTPVIVTGTMQTLSGGTIAQGTVTFQLANIGTGTIPRIIGTGEFPALKYVVMTDQSGNISTPLWGNDVIDPANTIYLVTFRDFLGNEVGPIQFSITGSAVSLNTLVPINTILPPVLTSFGFATGTPLVSGNFALSGWGTGATITGIHGTQMGCTFTITAGTMPSISPTVTLTFPTAYPNSPLSLAQITGGSGAVTDISIATSTTQAVFTYNGLPTATQTYTFSVFELGLGN